MGFPGGFYFFSLNRIVFFPMCVHCFYHQRKMLFFKGLKESGLRAASQLVKNSFCHWTVSICAAAITTPLSSDHLNPID